MTPGSYIRTRRQAAGVSVQEVAAIVAAGKSVTQRNATAELLDAIEADRLQPTLLIVTELKRAFALDANILIQLIEIAAGWEIPLPRLCAACGSSWIEPCASAGATGCEWPAGTNALTPSTRAGRPVALQEG